MRVLAIDTALEACSVAVLDTNQSTLAGLSLPMARGHAEALMPLVARVMGEAGVRIADIDRIAVTTGPGSFTGLRVGISAARGIALASGKPAFGVTTLAVFAAPMVAQSDALPVLAAIDARHNHVYVQVFGPGGRTLVAPRIAPIAEAARLGAGNPIQITGNAANAVAAAWPAGEPPPKLIEEHAAPDIHWVAQLGAGAPGPAVPPKPFYLRAPDAQPQDAAKLPRR